MKRVIYATAQDTEAAFYEALEKSDLDTMMSVWADDDDIVCVHPGGVRMIGYDAVRAGWEQIFAGDARLSFRLDDIVLIETVGLAMQSVVEHITLVGDGSPRGSAICTNIFLRTPSGWRLVMHHASPAPERIVAEPKGPLH